MQNFRNEWKYRFPVYELETIQQRLAVLLQPDEYDTGSHGYSVHSLYFDDFYNSCANENDGGTAKRFKYRIRFYNENPTEFKLERKEKFNGLCRKKTAILTPDMYNAILSHREEELFWSSSDPVIRQFCLNIMNRGFTPKAIIDYERVAYVDPFTNVRITLDMNISAATDFEHFTEQNYLRMPLLKKGEQVLEVKFDEILPGYIKQALTGEHMIQTAFSKYYYARNMLSTMGGQI